MITLFQKRVGHEPEVWEDLQIPAIPSHNVVAFVTQQFRDLKNEGHFRIVLADGTEVKFDIYRAEVFRIRIDGVVQGE